MWFKRWEIKQTNKKKLRLNILGKRTTLPTILKGQREICDWRSLKFELQHFLDYTAPCVQHQVT